MPSNPRTAPRLSGAGSAGSAGSAATAATILRAALDATGRTQFELAGLAGVGLSTVTDALAGRSDARLLSRLAWLLARHPELADELDAEFGAR